MGCVKKSKEKSLSRRRRCITYVPSSDPPRYSELPLSKYWNKFGVCVLCHTTCAKNFPIKKVLKDVKSQTKVFCFFFPLQNFYLWFEVVLSSGMGLPPLPPLFPLVITLFSHPSSVTRCDCSRGKKKELLRTCIFKCLLSDVFNPVALQHHCSHI